MKAASMVHAQAPDFTNNTSTGLLVASIAVGDTNGATSSAGRSTRKKQRPIQIAPTSQHGDACATSTERHIAHGGSPGTFQNSAEGPLRPGAKVEGNGSGPNHSELRTKLVRVGDAIELEPLGEAKRRLHSESALEAMSSTISNVATIIHAQRDVKNTDLGDAYLQGAPIGHLLQADVGAPDALSTKN